MPTTRAAVAADEPFLREMLSEALFVPPGAAAFDPAIVREPPLAHYVDGFGRSGDLGVIALEDGEPIGAAWVRALTADAPGYGYVDDHTPELSIALVPAWRGRGIGSRLLDELLQRADDAAVAAISLSCDRANPALRLYERTGFVPVSESDDSVTMVRPRGSTSRGW